MYDLIQSLPPELSEQICLTDRGYKGLTKLHDESYLFHKKKRNWNLFKEQPQSNPQLDQIQVKVEYVKRKSKVFRVLVERDRSWRERFGLRFYLIAGLLNY